jgi:hypothetical protein
LLPANAARGVIASAQQQSAAMALGCTVRMPAGTQLLPIVLAIPSAGWVDAGARKPITAIEWSATLLRVPLAA